MDFLHLKLITVASLQTLQVWSRHRCNNKAPQLRRYQQQSYHGVAGQSQESEPQMQLVQMDGFDIDWEALVPNQRYLFLQADHKNVLNLDPLIPYK